MAMPFAVAVQTSLRKYRRKKVRTFFGIVPTVFLFIFIVLLSGLAVSIDKFVHDRILLKLAQKEEVLELNKMNSLGQANPSSDPRSDADDPTTYTPDDISKIKGIEHIVDVQAQRPIMNLSGTTNDLVGDKQLLLSSFMGAPTDLARLYNADNFVYRQGEPIPIIISRSSFEYQNMDFGGKQEIKLTEVELSNPTKSREAHPIKRVFLDNEYDKSKLINKIFTVTLGGLKQTPQYVEKTNFSTGKPSIVYHKLSPAELQAEVKKQKDQISPYWNYDNLDKGVEVKFKIVGFNDSVDNANNILPSVAGTEIMQKVYEVQRTARTKTALPEEAYSTIFAGLKLNKTGQLTSTGEAHRPPELYPAKYEGDVQTPNELTLIPGLVFKFVTKDNVSTFQEVDKYIFEPSSLPIKSLTVTMDDAGNRKQVQKALTKAGFPEADGSTSLTGMLRGIRDGINTALIWIVGVLAGINSLILMSTVSRTVADAQREIGVYRALGARRRDIRKLYIVYSTLQTVIGIGAGLLVGLLAMIPLSNFLAGLSKKLIPVDSAGGTFMGFDINVQARDLQNFDWQSILIYSAALVVITVVVSLIPAVKAARTSPVEAIRRAD